MQVARAWFPWLAGGLTWLALATLVVVLLYYVDAKARLEVAGQARAALGEVRNEVDRRLQTALAVPETLAVVVAAGGRLQPATFQAIASRLIRANPSIRNVALAPDNVITAIHPLRGNEAAMGLRYAARPDQYPAVLQAIRTRRTVVAGPIALVQGGIGLVSRTPVYVHGRDGRDSDYWGLVSLAVDIDQLFTDIDRIAQRSGLAIAVRRADVDAPPGQAFVGDPALFAAAPVSAYYAIPGGGRLQFAAGPPHGWSSVGVGTPVRVVLQTLAALVGALVYLQVARAQRDRLMATRDALTGLLNRKAFDHRLSEAVLRSAPGGSGLIVVDLDGFKPVNDTYGHSAGDAVLQAIAERVQQAVGNVGSTYRIGGDEFAILILRLRGPGELTALAERMLGLIAQPVPLDGLRRVAIGASIGVAVFPVGGQLERAADVFDRADRALYRSKAQGGRSVQVAPSAETEPFDA